MAAVVDTLRVSVRTLAGYDWDAMVDVCCKVYELKLQLGRDLHLYSFQIMLLHGVIILEDNREVLGNLIDDGICFGDQPSLTLTLVVVNGIPREIAANTSTVIKDLRQAQVLSTRYIIGSGVAKSVPVHVERQHYSQIVLDLVPAPRSNTRAARVLRKRQVRDFRRGRRFASKLATSNGTHRPLYIERSAKVYTRLFMEPRFLMSDMRQRIEHGDVDFDKAGLHMAVKFLSGNVLMKVTKLLLLGGARLNSKDNLGRTPLHVACSNGHGRLALLLLELDAEMAEDSEGKTPLDLAIRSFHRRTETMHRKDEDLALARCCCKMRRRHAQTLSIEFQTPLHAARCKLSQVLVEAALFQRPRCDQRHSINREEVVRRSGLSEDAVLAFGDSLWTGWPAAFLSMSDGVLRSVDDDHGGHCCRGGDIRSGGSTCTSRCPDGKMIGADFASVRSCLLASMFTDVPETFSRGRLPEFDVASESDGALWADELIPDNEAFEQAWRGWNRKWERRRRRNPVMRVPWRTPRHGPTSTSSKLARRLPSGRSHTWKHGRRRETRPLFTRDWGCFVEEEKIAVEDTDIFSLGESDDEARL
eukprot:TRINITY_DN69168_c0_g1_i1.p1 TRINITY_DN69168_c0_g1~~TRINITY_DN69168_c0_g1_i1.p1  ORF type:complete len:613 (+),score=77.44 TRINITY_DN69168_c0_g1_i1:80-1840(+)